MKCEMSIKTLLKLQLCIVLIFISAIKGDYYTQRSSILKNELNKLPGSHLKLTAKEEKVNEILMKMKLEEFDRGFESPKDFLPSRHFFESKKKIEKSEVFKFIRRLPKGASLHSHSSAMLSFDAFYNLTYMDDLYGCPKNNSFELKFIFDKTAIPSETCKLLSTWREENSNFDTYLQKKMTLVVKDPSKAYKDIMSVWSKFDSIFEIIGPLLDYKNFLEAYLYQVFEEFHKDNVLYLELRSSVGEIFDSTGKVYNRNQTLQTYIKIFKKFKSRHPDFLGFKVIQARYRNVNDKKFETYIDDFLKLRAFKPNFIAGFDLVGQEDVGRPLIDFVPQLLEISNKTKFFFHAGETNWWGATDLNLLDALMLNTTRIGHAFAILKHPEIYRIAKERKIAIELNPISNQVLKLVEDLRNHPGSPLIADGYPVVITCDDPTFWGARGLSYDWYLAFMGMTPKHGDLKILKQLAFNSIIYSAMNLVEKRYALKLLEKKWNQFIDYELVRSVRGN